MRIKNEFILANGAVIEVIVKTESEFQVFAESINELIFSKRPVNGERVDAISLTSESGMQYVSIKVSEVSSYTATILAN